MQIGKGSRAVSGICDARADRIEVRGRDLTSELMGRIGFTDYFYLLLTGKEASEKQRFFLDLLLVAIAEHGLVPTVQAARMTLAADPGSLQGAVAAGILGAGQVILGTSEHCGRLLQEADAKVVSGGKPDAVALDLVRAIRAAGDKVPGFGHPIHKPVDPRAVRIFALAAEHGVAGKHVAMSQHIERAVAEVWGKPLVMNVSMPIAAVLLDLDFPAAMIKAIPLLARTASLLAHLAEEQQNPIGFLMAGKAEEAIAYERDGDGDA
jgi:citrate synthase